MSGRPADVPAGGRYTAPPAIERPAAVPLSKVSGMPLHEQVADYVREKIYSREWGQNEAIPSELELTRLLGVARGTVQKGIRALVDEGLLVQERGRGTFVTRPLMVRPSSTRLLSFAETMDAHDIAYTTQVVETRVEPASALCAERLGIAAGEDYLFLARVRSVRGRPAMFIESHLNLAACPGLDHADFTREGVFAAVERTSGQTVGVSDMVYSACVAGKKRGAWLDCDEHAPVLNCEQLVRLSDGTPCEWGSVWLPANRCVISNEMRRG